MNSTNVLIIGAGVAGKSLADNLHEQGIPMVGYLDDNATEPDVLGKLADINEIVKRYCVTDIYFSIPSAPAEVLRNFLNTIDNGSVKVSIIPRSLNIISKNTVNINDLTDVDILSLVGRQPVKQDLLDNKSFIKDKTVFVTGAAGSIGSKLVKLLIKLEPKLLVCIDWWENGMFFLQQDLKDIPNITYRIADIKNASKIDKLYAEFEPDITFHAAAYKHVPLMQANPLEAVNNNVWGSLNLMRMAKKHHCSNFVYVSTDKAVNPVNVMGATKRIGEMLLETLAAEENGTKYTAVRFGNVIQSNGSVMQIFKKQIENGEPLTVTHKDVTRYFMTVEEAAQLIIQSALLGNSGEIFVLDMGEPVKVLDLANSLIKLLNKPIDIKIIGLRPGEKMFEELSFDLKNVSKTENDKIYIVKNEKSFDKTSFIREVEEILQKTLNYSISDQELIDKLICLGFPIKKER